MDPLTRQELIKTWTAGLSFEQKIVRLFEKVRDIPYGDIGSRDPGDIIKQNKGTCSGKHALLKELYQEIGLSVKDFLILHRFKAMSVKFPQEIITILNRSDIVDPHNFIKIDFEGKWITVDVTWDKPTQKFGFIVNENWNGTEDMKIAVVPGGEIFETDHPIELKKNLISQLPESVQKDRKLFLEKLTGWLDYLRGIGKFN